MRAKLLGFSRRINFAEALSNNLDDDTEHEIHTLVMGKETYLFCRTDVACHRAALMCSMYGACKVSEKDTEKWLVYTLKHIWSTKPEDQHRLLPVKWTE